MSLELKPVDTKLTEEDIAVIEALSLISGKSKSEYLRHIIQAALKLEVDRASLIDQKLRDNGFSSGVRR